MPDCLPRNFAISPGVFVGVDRVPLISAAILSLSVSCTLMQQASFAPILTDALEPARVENVLTVACARFFADFALCFFLHAAFFAAFVAWRLPKPNLPLGMVVASVFIFRSAVV